VLVTIYQDNTLAYLFLEPVMNFRRYGVKVDVWAAGVITYILLCGYPPFRSETNSQEELFDAILASELTFPREHWDHISDSARDLICGALTLDANQRLSASDVLRHPWVAVRTARKCLLSDRMRILACSSCFMETKELLGILVLAFCGRKSGDVDFNFARKANEPGYFETDDTFMLFFSLIRPHFFNDMIFGCSKIAQQNSVTSKQSFLNNF